MNISWAVMNVTRHEARTHAPHIAGILWSNTSVIIDLATRRNINIVINSPDISLCLKYFHVIAERRERRLVLCN